MTFVGDYYHFRLIYQIGDGSIPIGKVTYCYLQYDINHVPRALENEDFEYFKGSASS